jgi:hypothetical protein
MVGSGVLVVAVEVVALLLDVTDVVVVLLALKLLEVVVLEFAVVVEADAVHAATARATSMTTPNVTHVPWTFTGCCATTVGAVVVVAVVVTLTRWLVVGFVVVVVTAAVFVALAAGAAADVIADVVVTRSARFVRTTKHQSRTGDTGTVVVGRIVVVVVLLGINVAFVTGTVVVLFGTVVTFAVAVDVPFVAVVGTAVVVLVAAPVWFFCPAPGKRDDTSK